MGAVYFYHLTDSPLEAALPALLTKARQAGWRIAVRGSDRERLDWLDKKLWLLGDESFLPHGLAGGPHDAMQPILLAEGNDAANAATCVMAVFDAAVEAAEVKALERVCILFDGNSSQSVEAARGQWKALTEAGCTAQYWAQDAGKWVKRAESG